MKTLKAIITYPEQCVKITICNHRHICDGRGGYYHAGKRVADCPNYISREDAYRIKLIERDVGE